MHRPPGSGDLLVDLQVSGAIARQSGEGVELKVETSKRRLKYGRLLVRDAEGNKLTARLEATGPRQLRVTVSDAGAAYPICIDPTFSDADWIAMGEFPGADHNVYALAADDQGNIYAGGSFTIIGNALANGIAKWNGSEWTPLGSGVSGFSPGTGFFGPWVGSLLVEGDIVYAGGHFQSAGGVTANGIARWNGTGWSALGTGLQGGDGLTSVNALIRIGVDLIVAGDFYTAGGTQARHIAKWSGSEWSALGPGMDKPVHALAETGEGLIAGGKFTSAGGNPANRIARWNGTLWSPLGAGMTQTTTASSAVYALLRHENRLYAGGSFSVAGGRPANSIAAWDGTSWEPLGDGITLNPAVRTLAIDNNFLYAGGQFGRAGGSPAEGIARWNGASWSALDVGVQGSLNTAVYALAVTGGAVYAGGAFSVVGDYYAGPAAIRAVCIAKWRNEAWSAFESRGVDSGIDAMALGDRKLYVAGGFTKAGGVDARYIAQWDGRRWSPLGSGLDGGAAKLLPHKGGLYAGGGFRTAGGIPVNRIAYWNGSEWSALGSGMDFPVHDMLIRDTELFASGAFTLAGGVSASRIARWDGTRWSALGPGLNDQVHALAWFDGALYAGGAFTRAGAVQTNYVARWDGNAWTQVGQGLGGIVVTLVAHGGKLYAGGGFRSTPWAPGEYVAAWDGQNWSAAGRGVSGSVYRLTSHENALIAQGDFYVTGNPNVRDIAQWDGTDWTSLGSSLSMGDVTSLVSSGPDFYAGGYFRLAGGKASPYLARAAAVPGMADADQDGLLDDWERHWFAVIKTSGPLDDDDDDGCNNLLEMAFGLDPAQPDAAGLPRAMIEKDYLQVSVTKRPGVRYTVETGSGTEPDSFSPAETTVLIDEPSLLVVRDNIRVSTGPRRFMRITVTGKP